jgi:hypothetical protein
VNVFVLHRDPYVAAQMACDKHVVKMIVETAQMLSAVLVGNGHAAPYKLTHQHHPCTIWAGKSAHNYAWLWHHGLALCQEYTYRYGKTHKTQAHFDGDLRHVPCLPRIGVTEFALAMPEEFRDPNPVIAYRKFYIGAKAHFCTWKERPEPLWFTLKQPELEL